MDMLRVLIDMNNEVVGNDEQHPTHVTQTGDKPCKLSVRVPCLDPHAHPDAVSAGNIPLPANYFELAANSSRNLGADDEARWAERGEETQYTEKLGKE